MVWSAYIQNTYYLHSFMKGIKTIAFDFMCISIFDWYTVGWGENYDRGKGSQFEIVCDWKEDKFLHSFSVERIHLLMWSS